MSTYMSDPKTPRERLAMWWWYHDQKVIGWAIVLFLLAIIGGFIGWAASEDAQTARRRAAACVKMWEATRTSADTVAVLARCELGEERHNTTVIPVFIPMGGR